MAKKKKTKSSKGNSKRGPKAWGKNLYGEKKKQGKKAYHENLYGEEGHEDKDDKKKKKLDEAKCDHEKEHPGMSHAEHKKVMKKEEPKKEAMSSDEYKKKGVYALDSDQTNKKKKATLKERADISRFIRNVATKNYAEANKYLQAACDTKMRQRIANTAKKLGI
jgi:hypothetical protein